MVKSKNLPKLQFSKNILPSLEKPIPTKELLVRLKDLSNELTTIDQEKIDISSLDTVKDALVNKKLLRNNNLGVQAYVACCLSDILRIYAPDAPFTATQLTDIFKLFFNQFKHLNEQETNGYFAQYYYLLSKLSEVRSIILITDLPESEKLIENVFEVFYGLANQPNFPLKLEPLICDVLSEIISESDSVPTKVLKLILNKFFNDKAIPNTVNPSLNFTLSICNTNSDRISRLITQFFSELIYDGSQDDTASAKFIENLSKLHRLAIEIWKYIPELLASVMGLIEDELDAENVTIRSMATETVSKILAIHPSKLNFIQTHSDTYTSWLKKTLDISPAVRSKWIETTLPIFLTNKNDVGDIVNGLTKCLLDTDEKVRFTTCKTLAQLPSKILLEKIASETIMGTLSQLIREKSPEIRNEIIKLLGNLYNDCWEEEKDNKLLSWIPDHILNLIYINDKNINALVDICLLERIIPFENDSKKRAERLLKVIQQLSEKSKSSFFAILKRQQQISGVMAQFLKTCEAYNGGQVLNGNDEPDLRRKLNKIIDWLAVGLPTYFNSHVCLERFIKLNNRRFYRLIKLCLSADSDYETIKNSMKELFNKLNDSKAIKLENDVPIPTVDMLNVFKLILYRSSLIIVNKSNIPEISDKAKDSTGALCAISKELLEVMSTNVPGVFKSHITELTNFVSGYTKEDSKGYYAQALKTIYHFLKQYKDFNEQLEIGFYDKLFQIALNGSVQESKYAVRIICLSRHKYSYTEDLLSNSYPLDLEDDNLSTRLAIISEFFIEVPTMVEEKAAEITSFLIKNILLANQPAIESEPEEEWIKDEDLEEGKHSQCQQKLLALNIFTNRLISTSSDPENDEAKIAALSEPVFKLFMSLIGNGGEIVKSANPTPKNVQSRLRLAAGEAILKLSKLLAFNKILNPSIINRLIFLIQDESVEVRSAFVDKLQVLLYEESISERFIPLLFFMAHEPEENLKNNVMTWLRSSFSKQNSREVKSLTYERSFSRLLHMTSHHQEYLDLMDQYFETDNVEVLLQAYSFALEYICFYLGLIANQDNISLLYYFASRLKQYHDSLIPESEYDAFQQNIETANLKSKMFNIYRISELAQLAIKEYATQKTWAISTYPGTFKLSADIFATIHSQEEAEFLVHNVFIEDTISSRLVSLTKSRVSHIGSNASKQKKKPVKRKIRVDNQENKENMRSSKMKKRIRKEVEYTGPVRKSDRNLNKAINYGNDDIDEGDDYE